MDVIVVFAVFATAMITALNAGFSMLLPLLLGFVLFSCVAVKRGISPKKLVYLCAGSFKDSFIVVGILLIIGCLTGIWRQSGTIAYFVTAGISVIPHSFFILAAFILTALMSFAIGTSFGVTATAGVILMSIARAGGVDTVLTAGAILSGVYVGDRGSPASSSANLVSVLTHTDMRDNVRKMLKTAIIPFVICLAAYGLLSVRHPMQQLDNEVTASFAAEFNLSWVCLIPAVLMVILPFAGMRVKSSMFISLLVSIVISLAVQGNSVLDCLRAVILGYDAKEQSLAPMLSGGGIVSMAEVSGILLISGTYGAVFKGANLLEPVKKVLLRLKDKIGRYPVMLMLSAGVCMLFCNQTISAIMQNQLSDGMYGDSDSERNAKMLDMENSVILVAGLVPWCIACSVPLAMMGVSAQAVPYAFYLWLLPVCWLIVRKKT